MKTQIDKIFDNLEHWKKLPAYKAEPRVDWLVGAYLDQILHAQFGSEMELLIPEFPLRIGTIYPDQESTVYAERSYKVDFYAMLRDGRHLFIEFKTDSLSRRDKQDAYLLASQNAGILALLQGVVKIAKVSPYKKKYNYLLNTLADAGLLIPQAKVWQVPEQTAPLEIVYIQPRVLNPQNPLEIPFSRIAEIIAQNPDPFSQRLVRSLLLWGAD